MLVLLLAFIISSTSFAAENKDFTKQICDFLVEQSILHASPQTSCVDEEIKCDCAAPRALSYEEKKERELYLQNRAMAPSEVIPEMYKLLESRYFDTNPNFKEYYYEKEGDKTVKVRSRPYTTFSGFANEHMHIDTSTDTPCFYWTRRPGDLNMTEDFWWYEGRKYMSQIWDQWYTCWKIEMASENVRTSVVAALSGEMSDLGMYTLPYINEAIKAGDKTLDPLIQSINRNYTVNLKIPLTANFLAWYATNSWKYTLPPCEGLENARKRLATSNPDYVKELSGVTLTNAVGEDISHLGNGWRSNFPKLEKGMAEYYANPPLVPKHWYYQLPDGMEYSAWNPRNIFSPVTNVNFKAIETLKMMKRGKN